MLLDCGLIQGGRDAERRNREPFPFDPAALDRHTLADRPSLAAMVLPLDTPESRRQAYELAVAVCDADQSTVDKRLAAVNKTPANASKGYLDVRKMLDSKEIDSIVIATPNHWHSLGTIWACQAGKDVYVEKPVSHNVWEGRKIVEAARK